MSSITGNVKFSVNYPVYVTTTPYNLPAYEYNFVFSNLSTNSVINMPPVSSVPNGWTVSIINVNGTGIVTLYPVGSDLLTDSTLSTASFNNYQLSSTGVKHIKLIAQHTTNGNFWFILINL